MPFQKPNSLTEEQYYQIVAFLLRQNALIDGQMEVNASNATNIIVSRATPVVTPQQADVQKGSGTFLWVVLIVALVIVVLAMFVLKKSRNTTTI